MNSPDQPDQPDHPLMASIARYVGGEPVTLASVVYWNVVEAEGFAKLKALVARFGRGGADASAGAPDDAQTGRYTCDVGVIAVGNAHVFRLRLGKAPMVGAPASRARLPAELLAAFPAEFYADEIAAIRPLSVTVDRDWLHIRALGRGSADFLVRTTQWRDLALGAETIAAAVRALAPWPAPEDAIAAIVTADRLDPQVARALADRDYAATFTQVCARQPADVRRALILAARAGAPVLKSLIDRGMRGGGPGLRTIIVTVAFCALLVFGGAAATVMLGTQLLAGARSVHGALVPLSGADKLGMIAFMSVFGFASICAGLTLAARGWRYVDARRTELGLFAAGGGLGGRRDALLALVALKGTRLSPPDWRDVEAATTTDSAFADRLRASLLAIPAASREAFLAAAPPGLRRRLVQSLVARKGPAQSLAARGVVVAWLVCLAAGAFGAATEAPQASLTPTDWMLLAASAGALPAIGLLALQIAHTIRSRRLQVR